MIPADIARERARLTGVVVFATSQQVIDADDYVPGMGGTILAAAYPPGWQYRGRYATEATRRRVEARRVRRDGREAEE